MATGVGKSVVIAGFITELIQNHPSQRVMCVIDTKELVQQNYEKVLQIDPFFPAGLYSAGLRKKDTKSQVVFAGIQSAYKNAFKFGKIDVLMIDECHMVGRDNESMWRTFIDDLKTANPNMIIIGLTATPYRLDSGMLWEGENAIFGGVAYKYGIKEAIADGYLTELVSKPMATKLDITGVGRRGGDFIESQLQKAINVDEITRSAVKEIVEAGQDRHGWLVFAAGIEHAEAIKLEIESYGIVTDIVTGKTPNAERDRIIKDFKEKKIRCLVNVAVLTKGFDAPHIDLLATLRPTESAVLWSQCVGRGLRLVDGSIGNLPTAEERKQAIAESSKPDCILLDFAENVKRFGFIDEIEYKKKFYVGEGESTGDMPVKECPKCQIYVPAGLRICKDCGHEFPPPEISIQGKSHAGAILSHQQLPEDHNVTMMFCHVHGGFNGKKKSMRIDYLCSTEKFSEWICFEHEGYARKQAEQWWSRYTDGDRCENMEEVTRYLQGCPKTVEEALKFEHTFKKPAAIRVKKQGKYWRILAKSMEEIPSEPEQQEDQYQEEEIDLLDIL